MSNIEEKDLSGFGEWFKIHFVYILVAFIVTAASLFFGTNIAAITSVAVLVVALVKKVYFDKDSDWADFIAAMLGMILAWLCYVPFDAFIL